MHKTWNYDRLQCFINEVLKSAKKADQEKKPEDPKGKFPDAQRRSTTSMVDLTAMSRGGRRMSPPRRS
jgi:hypothetical protein